VTGRNELDEFTLRHASPLERQAWLIRTATKLYRIDWRAAATETLPPRPKVLRAVLLSFGPAHGRAAPPITG